MILVTGSGNLSKRLVAKLLNENEKVRCLVLDRPKDLNPAAEVIVGNPLDEATVKKAFQGIDAVFHLLDVKGTKRLSRGRMKQINIKGTRNLLAAAEKAGVKKFIFLSTFEVYGRSKKIPTRTDDRKKPITRYGRDKLKAEAVCQEFIKKGTMSVTIVRPAMVIGPGTGNPVVLIALLMALGMGDDNRLFVAGNGDTKFQLLHPDDAVDAIILAWKTDAARGKIFNVGSDNVPTQMEQTVKIKELAKLECTVRHLSPGKAKMLYRLFRPFKLSYLTKEHVFYLLNNMLLDCQHAKSDLKWEPKKNNIDILLETIRWYETEKL